MVNEIPPAVDVLVTPSEEMTVEVLFSRHRMRNVRLDEVELVRVV
jgi:hypothetical protein